MILDWKVTTKYESEWTAQPSQSIVTITFDNDQQAMMWSDIAIDIIHSIINRVKEYTDRYGEIK